MQEESKKDPDFAIRLNEFFKEEKLIEKSLYKKSKIVIPDIYDFELKPGGYERFLDSIYLKFRFPKRPLAKGQEPSSGLYP